MLKDQSKLVFDKLIATYLSKGVQPSDIADTLFEDHYVDMSIKKCSGNVHLTFSFEEEGEEVGQSIRVSMKYTYNPDKYLQTIEQKVGKGRYKAQWDRALELKNLMDELVVLASKDRMLREALDTLPEEILTIAQCSKAA